jgi:hypothetical protein
MTRVNFAPENTKMAFANAHSTAGLRSLVEARRFA